METADRAAGLATPGERLAEGRPARRSTAFDAVRWCMLALWILVIVLAVTLGSQTSRLSNLESGLSAGDVTSVRVTPGMAEGAEGVAMQSVFWRSGFLDYRADVFMVSPGNDSEASPSDDNVTVRSGYDIAEQLGDGNPNLVITQIPERRAHGIVYGFDVPLWLLWFVLIGSIGTLLVLVSGPQPWRATRWAWLWLLPTVIGPPLFLIFSGPTPPFRAPREDHRRLTGGWAFLAALVLHSVLQR